LTATRLDVFDVLKRIGLQDVDYYNSLSAHDKKQFVPFLILQWLGCSNHQLQTVLTNEYINKYVFSLYDHPELLYYLMLSSSGGPNLRYKWVKRPKQVSSYPISVQVVCESYECSKKRAMEHMDLLQSDDIVAFAQALGYQADQIKTIQVELKSK